MNADKPGLVIAFDGPDGVGKTTQIGLAAAFLNSRGYSTHITRFSGGTPISKLLREVSLSDTPRQAETDLYISLAMGVDLAADLRNRKAAGEICLVDRSPITMLGYNVYGSQLEDKQAGFTAVDKLMNDWQVDMLIYFEAPQSVLDERRRERTDKPLDYFEKLGPAYHARVRAGYEAGLDYLKQSVKHTPKLVEVDAKGDIEQIQQMVQKSLVNLL